MDIVRLINQILSIIFLICYAYQFVYLLVPFFLKKPKPEPGKLHSFAVLISARNEEAVIANLLQSIRAQNYPQDKLSVFVVADNCTDATADIARREGAIVWEREDSRRVGKGYALDYLLQKISDTYPPEAFDGYFIFDADNLLDENYVREMNNTFSSGYRIVTSYRNTKNFGSNWISAGYALWFLREAKYVNYPRMLLGTSCAVSGTGFLFHRDILTRSGGWKFFLLTEDIEFTVSNILAGEKIGYCGSAVFYDEQPTSFRQSCRQRMRWSKGFLQVFHKYGIRLLQGIGCGRGFACYDMTMTLFPAIVLTMISIFVNFISLLLGVWSFQYMIGALQSLGEMLLGAYIILFTIGTITTITEWKQIHSKARYKILYLFTFPIFMFTYIPISFIALFRRVEWKPIRHDQSKTLEEVRGAFAKYAPVKEENRLTPPSDK